MHFFDSWKTWTPKTSRNKAFIHANRYFFSNLKRILLYLPSSLRACHSWLYPPLFSSVQWPIPLSADPLRWSLLRHAITLPPDAFLTPQAEPFSVIQSRPIKESALLASLGSTPNQINVSSSTVECLYSNSSNVSLLVLSFSPSRLSSLPLLQPHLMQPFYPI